MAKIEKIADSFQFFSAIIINVSSSRIFAGLCTTGIITTIVLVFFESQNGISHLITRNFDLISTRRRHW
jgi:hypothetical protein